MRSATALAVLLGALGTVSPAAAQSVGGNGTKVLSIDDYARWRTIDNASLSPDGKWAAYGLRFSNLPAADSRPVLHLRDLGTNREVEIPDASQATFSPDSHWVVYQVDPRPPARGRRGGAPDSVVTTTVTTVTTTVTPVTPGAVTPAPTPAPAPAPATGRGAAGPPIPPRRWELRELATGKTRAWQQIQSAVFSPTGSHLLLRQRPAGSEAPGGGGGNAGGVAPAASPAHGSDAILVELASGHSLFLGSLGESAFNRGGDLLAYTVDAPVRDGNGLAVLALATGRTTMLDNDSLRYSRLAWNDRGTGIAVLKGREMEKLRERHNTLLVFPDVAAAEPVAATLDPVTAAGFPKHFELSERVPLVWSDDGRRVFVSIIPQTAAPDTGHRKASPDSVADVDIWRTEDQRIQSVQMVQAESERDRTFREEFDVATGRYVALSDSTMRELELPAAGDWAVGRDPRPYISDYKHPAADIFRVNLLTGERTRFLTGQLTGAETAGVTPDGRGFLYWADGRWQRFDLAAGTSRPLAAPAGLSFADMEFDHPGPRPPYPVAGYASDGSGVIVDHRFDLWLLPFDPAAAPRNLTNGVGARDKVVYRYVRTAPVDSSVKRAAQASREIDLSRPVTLSTYGEFTKKAGFSRLANGTLQPLLWDDAAFSTPLRAAHGERYLYTRQTFAVFPDLLVSDSDLAHPVKISDANPQQAEYRWGHRVLFDFTTRRGDKLQGILGIPDDYQPGEKRPMLVTFYEKNSQTMHRYTAPSYITGMGAMPIEAVSRGYVTMIPDVAFHNGSSHSDMLDAVEAATRKVIALGYADPKHIGVHGHSYGGEGAAFIGTRSRLFAAVGVGAGVTDLFTDFSQSWGWSYQVASGGSGENGSGYYLYGQGRWGFSPWERPDVYHFESALSHVPEVTAPILIMHGTADPTVSFSEGMNFYNALRYNGKEATLLAYTNEGHGLRGLANRRDLTIRYFQFFDHYLKGAPAPRWLTQGVSYIDKDPSKAPN